MPRQSWKRWVLAGAILTIATGLGGFGLTTLGTLEEQLRDHLRNRISDLDRGSIGWDRLEFGFISGLTINGLVIRTPDVGGPPFQCEKITFGLDPIKLLSGRPVFDRTVITSPALVIRPEDTDRLTALIGTISAITSSGPDSFINLKKIRVLGGLVTYSDRPGRISRTLRRVDLEIDREMENFALKLSCSLARIPIRATGLIRPNRKSATLDFSIIDAENIDLIEVLPSSLGFDLPQGRFSADLTANLKGWTKLRAKGRFQTRNGSFHLHPTNRFLTGLDSELKTELSLDLKSGDIEILEAELTMADQSFGLQGKVLGDGLWDLEAKAKNINLAHLSKLLGGPGPDLSGRADMALRVTSDDPREASLDLAFETSGLSVGSGPERYRPGVIKGSLKGVYDQDKLALNSAELLGPGLILNGQGSFGPREMNLELTSLALDLDQAWISVRELLGFRISGRLSSNLSLQGPPFKPSDWKFSGEADLDDLALHIPDSLLRVALSGPLTAERNVMKINKLKGTLGPTEFTLDGSLDLRPDRPQAEIELKTDTLDLKRILADYQIRELALELPPPMAIQVKGRVKIGSLIHPLIELRNLSTKFRYSPNNLLLAPLEADLNHKGKLNLKLLLSSLAEDPVYQGHLTLQQAELGELPGLLSIPRTGVCTGTSDLTASFGGHLANPGDLSLEVKTRVTGGALQENAALQAMSRYLGLTEFQVLSFDLWEGEFRLKNKHLELKGGFSREDLRLTYLGRMGLDGELDVGCELRFKGYPEPSPEQARLLNQAGVDAQGLYVLPLVLSGRGKKVAVELDPARVSNPPTHPLLGLTPDQNWSRVNF